MSGLDEARCEFLIREPGTMPRDIRLCGRTYREHPVRGLGRFANHTFMLRNGRRAAAPAEAREEGPDA